jgi:hypothetical protein
MGEGESARHGGAPIVLIPKPTGTISAQLRYSARNTRNLGDCLSSLFQRDEHARNALQILFRCGSEREDSLTVNSQINAMGSDNN